MVAGAIFADSMGNEIEHVQSTDALLLKQIDRMGAPFIKHGRQYSAAVDRGTLGRKSLHGGSLQHSFESAGNLRGQIAATLNASILVLLRAEALGDSFHILIQVRLQLAG